VQAPAPALLNTQLTYEGGGGEAVFLEKEEAATKTHEIELRFLIGEYDNGDWTKIPAEGDALQSFSFAGVTYADWPAKLAEFARRSGGRLDDLALTFDGFRHIDLANPPLTDMDTDYVPPLQMSEYNISEDTYARLGDFFTMFFAAVAHEFLGDGTGASAWRMLTLRTIDTGGGGIGEELIVARALEAATLPRGVAFTVRLDAVQLTDELSELLIERVLGAQDEESIGPRDNVQKGLGLYLIEPTWLSVEVLLRVIGEHRFRERYRDGYYATEFGLELTEDAFAPNVLVRLIDTLSDTGQFPRLNELTLLVPRLSAGIVARLTTPPFATQLDALTLNTAALWTLPNLGSVSAAFNAAGLSALTRLHLINLDEDEEANMPDAYLTDERVRDRHNLFWRLGSLLPQLTELRLTGNNVNLRDQTFDAVFLAFRVEGATDLREALIVNATDEAAEFTRSRGGGGGEIRMVEHRFRHLRTLELTGAPITIRTLSQLAYFGALDHLTTLILRDLPTLSYEKTTRLLDKHNTPLQNWQLEGLAE
jgi:hypothetical protein